MQSRFDANRCCVIIPTYNNAGTLNRVLNELIPLTQNVIVINDGSTDHTATILEKYTFFKIVTLGQNKGKGNALKTGFKTARALGFEYAISMDSDGQHFPDDLPVFLDALENRRSGDPEILVVGSRKMDDPSVPQKSNFGNRCSTFWFKVETGIELQDTQCGYRLYPLKVVNELNLKTEKFELEIEVLVKAVWKGVNVINLPVKVLYDPQERVTHFRPFEDVARITLLNIWFVIVAYVYIFPRDFFRKFQGNKQYPVRKSSFTDSNLPLK